MNENGSETGYRERSTDFCPNVKSFVTEKGSVYQKSGDGRFIRSKYDGTVDIPQEFTLFIDENKTGSDFERFNHPIPKLRENMTVVLMQKKENSSDELEPIFKREQIHNPNSVFIQMIDFNKDEDEIFGELIPATLIPYENADVFEIENIFPEEDKDNFAGTATKTHLGHKITKIN